MEFKRACNSNKYKRKNMEKTPRDLAIFHNAFAPPSVSIEQKANTRHEQSSGSDSVLPHYTYVCVSRSVYSTILRPGENTEGDDGSGNKGKSRHARHARCHVGSSPKDSRGCLNLYPGAPSTLFLFTLNIIFPRVPVAN